jgi:hypothetical protein
MHLQGYLEQEANASFSETAVKVIDVRDTKKIQMLEGHERGIRALSWSPDGQLVVRGITQQLRGNRQPDQIPDRQHQARTAPYAYSMFQTPRHKSQHVYKS